MKCVCCGGDHNSFECPLFGSAKGYITTAMRGAPAPLAKRPPPTLFEELYGGELGVLQDVVEDQDNYDADERSLALRLLGGHQLSHLGADDRSRLDSIARGLAGALPRQRRHEPVRSVPPPRQEHEEEEEGPTGAPDAAMNRAFRYLMDNDDMP